MVYYQSNGIGLFKGRVQPLSLGELGHLPNFMQGKLTPELILVNKIVVMVIGVAVIMVSQSAMAWFSN